MDQAAQEVITEVVPVETAETPVVPAGDTAKPEGAEQEKPVGDVTFTAEQQARVNEIVEKRLARDRKQREREQPQARQPVVVDQVATDPAAPKRDDYEDYQEYLRADARFVALEAVKADREREVKAANDAKEAEDQTAALKAFDGQMNAAITKYPDFEDTEAVARTLPITDAMFNAIIRLDEGAELVYFFGKNPAEAQRISQLHPTRQAAEVGRLAAKVASQPAPKPASVSKAPAPIEPVGGNVVSSDKAPDDPDEYLKWHNAQERAKRQGKRT